MREEKTARKADRKTVRFNDEMLVQLEALADARRMPVAAVVRTACEVYLQREEFAVALGDVEARMAASLNNNRKDTARVAEDVQLLIAIVDQLAKFIMMTTPELIDKEGGVALGTRRHAGFIAELHGAFSSRRKKATLTQELDRLEGEDSDG